MHLNPVQNIAIWCLAFVFTANTAGVVFAQDQSTPLIATDKNDYQPGELVIVSGHNWQPGEKVTLRFGEEPYQHEPITLVATANEEGKLTNTELQIQNHDLNTKFFLTATGQTSGRVATTTFTDSTRFSSVISPARVITSQSVTFTITVTNTNTSPTVTKIGSIAVAVPLSFGTPTVVGIAPSNGKVWNLGNTNGFVNGYRESTNEIGIVASNGSQEIVNNENITIQIAVNAPPQTSTTIWTTSAWGNSGNNAFSGSAFTISTPQPTVEIGSLITPEITWPTPQSIYYGDLLSNLQLNASPNVPGIFTYNPGLNTQLSVGTHTLSATFVPDNQDIYSTTSASVYLTVLKAYAPLNLSNLNHTFDKTTKNVIVHSTPDNLSGVTITYNGYTTPPKTIGRHRVIVTLNNPNYQAGPLEETLEILPPNPITTDPSTLQNIFATPSFTVPDDVSNSNTPSFSASGQVTVNLDQLGSSILLPQGTVITRADNQSFNTSDLTASTLSGTLVSNIGSDVSVEGALRWGIPNVSLNFSQPITLKIFVGTNLDGRTFSILRSSTGDSGWTSDGITGAATCIVLGGICEFQATKASYYAATRTVAPTVSTTPAGAPICTDAKPSTSPMLLSVKPNGLNSASLTWFPTAGPATYYLVAYGTSPSSLQYGNPNVGLVTSYTVNALSAGKYYFRVRAGNDCMPGDYSNEVSVTVEGPHITTPPQDFAPGVLSTKSEASPKTEQNQVSPSTLPTPANNQRRSGIGDFFGKIFSSLRRLISFLR